MKLYLLITEGPQKGQKVAVRQGLQIGRAAPGLRLKDPKASALHAEIQIFDDGTFWVVDQGSTNKIRTAKGRRDRVELVLDEEFTIGSTKLRVVGEEPAKRKVAAEISIAQEVSKVPEWRKALVDFLIGSPLRHKHLRPPIGAFVPALELEFIQGYQTGTIWTLAYGPRQLGRTSPDLLILEPNAPDTSFEIHPSRRGPAFITEHSDKVRLNNKSVSSEILKDGDVISVGNSKLRMRFI